MEIQQSSTTICQPRWNLIAADRIRQISGQFFTHRVFFPRLLASNCNVTWNAFDEPFLQLFFLTVVHKVYVVTLTQQQFVAISVVKHYFFFLNSIFFVSFLRRLCRNVCVTSPTLGLTSSGLNPACITIALMSVMCIMSEFNLASKTPKSMSSKA